MAETLKSELYPKIGVVIVNYNNYNDTIKYINKYLLKQSLIDLKIVIVDNHSPNESFSQLKQEFSGNSKIKLILNDKNSGYSGGNNIGISFLEISGFEYILISNNDIEIDDEFLLNKLIDEYNKLANIAFISPLMLIHGNVSRVHYAWRLPDKCKEILTSTFLLKFLGQSYLKKFYYDLPPDRMKPVKVDCLPGSFFLGKTDIFLKTGCFDEKTFLYYEETITGKNVKDLNMQNYLIPGLFYNHFQECSINTDYSYMAKHRLLVDSKLYYWKNYKNAGKLFLWLLKLLFYINVFETLIVKPGKIFYEKVAEQNS